MTVASPDRTDVLEEKIDALTAQVARIADEAREQRLRREAWDELRLDVTPLMGQAMATVSTELEDVQEFVSAEDLIRVFKRLLRNTRRIEESLERFESAMEFLDDAGTLTDEAFIKAMQLLEELDHGGAELLVVLDLDGEDLAHRAVHRSQKAGVGRSDHVAATRSRESEDPTG